MVASISARRDIKSAAAYYTHSATVEYYQESESNGIWLGRAAEFLSLSGAIEKPAFVAALQGNDPNTDEQLVRTGGKNKTRQPGWDICLSAPKSVSVAWALAPDEATKAEIHAAHRIAVEKTSAYIEANFAKCRRGKGGKIRENTAGLLIGQFQHGTSRSLCPQLHTHLFIFNMAPRQDGSWGAILSEPLFKAQKQIGARFRHHLHEELQRLRIPSRLNAETIRIEGIDRKLEMLFSVRRRQILRAMEEYGYKRDARGFEKATLRTRTSKIDFPIERLRPVWAQRARSAGYSPEMLNTIWRELRTKAPIVHEIPKPMAQRKLSRQIKQRALALLTRAAKYLARKTEAQRKPQIQSAAKVLIDIASRALRLDRRKDRPLVRKHM